MADPTDGTPYATALAGLRDQRDGAYLAHFASVALMGEREDDALRHLPLLKARFSPTAYHYAMVRLLLKTEHHEHSIDHIDALVAAGATGAWIDDLRVAAASRANDPDAAIRLLNARIQKGNGPLRSFLNKWELQQQIRHFDAVEREIGAVEKALPPDSSMVRAWLGLFRAGLAHNRLNFAESIERLDVMLSGLTQGDPPFPLPPVRAEAAEGRVRTARGLLRLTSDLEALILTHPLNVVFTGGALLGLIRDGAFLPGDTDLDLAVLSPTTAEEVERVLIGSRLFERKPGPMDFGDYRVFHHRSTGLVLDLVVHIADGQHRVSTWHPAGGPLLRRLSFPAYGMTLVDHAGIGRRIPVPSDPERHLEALYGDWRTKDSGFDTTLSARNLVGSTDFIASLGRLRAVTALLGGARSKAQAILRQLLHHEPCSEILARAWAVAG